MRITSILSAVLLAAPSFPQQPVPESNVVIQSSTREVLLELMVRDAKGRQVSTINPSQIQVFENGVRQEIRSFRLVQGHEVRAQDENQAQPAPAEEASSTSGSTHLSPLRTVNTICLVMNDLTPDTRAFAFDAARKFVTNELRPDTFIGVFTLDGSGLRPVFPFSNNRDNLVKAVELASSKQLPPLHQSMASILNGLSITAATQPTGFGNLANQNALNGLSIDPSGAPVQAGLSVYGYSDGASTAEPLGARGDMNVAGQAGMREIEALMRLVRQLSALPFQKTVLLMGSGLTRPTEQLNYWNSLIKTANTGGVTFYALDIYGLGVCQDKASSQPGSANDDCANGSSASAASVALLQKSAAISQTQSTIARDAGTYSPQTGPGVRVNVAPSEAPQLMEAMHQSDYARFGVLSANTQEALRELSESTGGFLIGNTNNSAQLLTKVMDAVDTHYELSYRPASDREDGHFRKIEVKLASPDLRVQTRSGYFAVPESPEAPLTPADIAGLGALDTKPLPHAFDFQSKAFRFRSEDGNSQYAVAFQVPIANLKATPDAAQKKQRFHASLLALVKDANGEILERMGRDVPAEVPDASVAALRGESMTYEHTISIPPGRYTIETAVVDHESHRASTNILEIDNKDQPGLAVSDIALVHMVQNLKRLPDASDPFEIPGKRATPFVSTSLPAGADPFVYFVVYPEKNSAGVPSLRAEFLRDGKVLATQKSALPAPDESGAIPMTIRAIREPGDYEVKVTVEQGRASAERAVKYTIAAK